MNSFRFHFIAALTKAPIFKRMFYKREPSLFARLRSKSISGEPKVQCQATLVNQAEAQGRQGGDTQNRELMGMRMAEAESIQAPYIQGRYPEGRNPFPHDFN